MGYTPYDTGYDTPCYTGTECAHEHKTLVNKI
jgi:hypothetical protein